ncbi:hypothetical protein CVT25_005215, partial [Psilocybe cyanescens]
MLEAKLQEAGTLKSCLMLVTDANFECNEEGIMLQAMDNSLVALVSVNLGAPGFTHHCGDHPMLLGVNLTSLTKVRRCAKDDGICSLKAADEADVLNLFGAPGFTHHRCDRPMPLGVNLTSLTKVLRCAKDDDICTLKAADEADVLNLVYEAKNDARVTLPSSKFTRIVRDLSQLGESVRIEFFKGGVRFTSDGEVANGSVILRQSDGAHVSGGKIKPKVEEGAEGAGEGDGEAKEEEDREE